MSKKHKANKKAFKMPSKTAIREAFNIPKDVKFQVKVRDTMPKPSRLRKAGEYLESVGEFFGTPAFLVKRIMNGIGIGTIIVAVFFFPYWGPKIQNEVSNAVAVSSDYWEAGFKGFSNLPKQPALPREERFAIVSNGVSSVADSWTFLNTGYLSAGTSIYPISGAIS